jgi:hypothetical protein
VAGINKYLTSHTNWLTVQYGSFLVGLLIREINIEDCGLNGM